LCQVLLPRALVSGSGPARRRASVAQRCDRLKCLQIGAFDRSIVTSVRVSNT
jgi:hypothetical protein